MSTLLTTIPFPGLYETSLDKALDHELDMLVEHLDEEHGLTLAEREALYDHIWRHAAFPEAHQLIAQRFAETFADLLDEEAEFEHGLTFESMQSPRFYNFETDRVFMHVGLLTVKHMLATVPRSKFQDVLARRFSPRSGFIPHYSADALQWDDKPVSAWDHNEVGTLLVAYLEHVTGEDVAEFEDRIESELHEAGVFSEAVDTALPQLDEELVQAAREGAKEAA